MYLGDFPVNGTVFFLWNTHGANGASITRSVDGTLKIYKGNATHATWATERTSLNGVTQSEDFDAATGIHAVSINLSDNTDAGFYAAGNEYQVAITATTIDGQVVNAVLAHFSIERANGILALIKDATNGLTAIKNKANDVETDTQDIQSRLPAVLVSGRIDASVGAMAAGVVTAAAVATGAIDADALAADAAGEIADAVWDEARSGHVAAGSFGEGVASVQGAVTGSVGSVTGAVGSVTGSVGSVTGSVGSVTGAVGSVTAAVTVGTNNDKTGYALSAAGVQAIWDALTSALTTVGSIGKLLVDRIDAAITSRLASGNVTVGGYAAGQGPADLVLVTPANKLTTDASGNVTVAGLSTSAKAEVNTEVVDALNTDTYAEPGQGVPPATTTIVTKIGYVYKFLRNKITDDGTTVKVYADDTTTVDHKSSVSDDGTTFTRGEFAAGP